MVPAAAFLRHFASDRSHMWDGGEKRWQQQPPPWPCITAPTGAQHTLPAYLAMPAPEGARSSAAGTALAVGPGEEGSRGSGSSGGGEGGEDGRFGVVLTEEGVLECFGP